MNKSDLVAAIINNSDTFLDMSKGDIDKVVSAVFVEITAALVRDEEVAIKGFGTFTASAPVKMVGHNVRTGEPLQVLGSREPRFKAGNALKAAVLG